jgi:hypothetical protein
MTWDRRFDTKQAAAFLTDRGFKTAPATLTKLRCVGGGPQFEHFGRRPLYREAELLNWALARTQGPIRSTSELGAQARLEARVRRSTSKNPMAA